jgi:diguanylate cyclase (GGDEF)-like protein
VVEVVIVAAGALGAAALAVLAVCALRAARAQTAQVATMLLRYDDRMVRLLTVLERTLQSARGAGAVEAAHTVADRAVSTALTEAAQTAECDAAIAIWRDTNGEPAVVSVGLSDLEEARVVEIGLPDRRGARAVEISFSPDRLADDTVRLGLTVGIPCPSASPAGAAALLSRNPQREFADGDVAIIERAAAAIARTLAETEGGGQHEPTPTLDALTGLYDRQSFHRLLARETHAAQTSGNALHIVMLDVDRLAALNARIGSTAADELLVEVAARLRTVLAGYEAYPCRIGGGRLAAIVSRADEGRLTDTFKRLRTALAASTEGRGANVSVSIGIAQLEPLDDPAMLVARADAALALAKSSADGGVVGASSGGGSG